VESSYLDKQVDTGRIMIVDSSTISLFVDVYKGAGRNPITGKKKGGLKIHAKLPLGGSVPDLIHLTEAACNDKSFLGQLSAEKGAIYVFDKGYVKYRKWKEWSEKGIYFVTGSTTMRIIRFWKEHQTTSVIMPMEGSSLIR